MSHSFIRQRLFYRNGQAMMSVAVTTTGRTFRFGNPQRLFEGPYVPESERGANARSYAVGPDGRFLLMKETTAGGNRRLVVVANWAGELRRLAVPGS